MAFCVWRRRRRRFAWPMSKAMPRLRWRLFARLPSAAFARWCCPSSTCAAIPRPTCSITARCRMPVRPLWYISSTRLVSCRLSLPSVFPLQLPRISTTAPPCAARASFWVLRPKSICPTMASSTSAVGLLRRLRILCGSSLPVRVRFRWVRGLSTAAVMRAPRTWCWALRSVRTCGCRRPLRPRWRLPVRR